MSRRQISLFRYIWGRLTGRWPTPIVREYENCIIVIYPGGKWQLRDIARKTHFPPFKQTKPAGKTIQFYKYDVMDILKKQEVKDE